ncbi:Hypothetical predicted protein [Octopus vulgaris]|uniref:Uncharacterized protein n=1 Tax=Octopus vulgaris TaxID=6645 RepID=A0AA36AM64_OCTVU|nr:Hypothetical predicted protein [Octopus vulgaris]
MESLAEMLIINAIVFKDIGDVEEDFINYHQIHFFFLKNHRCYFTFAYKCYHSLIFYSSVSGLLSLVVKGYVKI